jgi:hypothetical protein
MAKLKNTINHKQIDTACVADVTVTTAAVNIMTVIAIISITIAIAAVATVGACYIGSLDASLFQICTNAGTRYNFYVFCPFWDTFLVVSRETT